MKNLFTILIILTSLSIYGQTDAQLLEYGRKTFDEFTTSTSHFKFKTAQQNNTMLFRNSIEHDTVMFAGKTITVFSDGLKSAYKLVSKIQFDEKSKWSFFIVENALGVQYLVKQRADVMFIMRDGFIQAFSDKRISKECSEFQIVAKERA